MTSLDSTSLLTVLALVAIMSLLLMGLMLWYRSIRDARYDQERQRMELGALRAALEHQMYMLTDRLVSTEDRWRDVNHLLISSQQRVPDASPTRQPFTSTQFLRSFGIDGDAVRVEPDLVFVLTPFHDAFAPTFSTIAATCRNLGLRCLRGDEEYVEADVMQHTLRLLVRARVVVAVIDGRNPNVFYELGLAHGLDKTTILIAKATDDIPFDVRSRKIVLYTSQDDLAERLQAELARTVLQKSTEVAR